MITIQDLDFHYGSRAIFDQASLQIKPKQRIGLIGQNGRGKTTLLKLINKDLTPDGGSIEMAKETTLGFLNQDLLSFRSSESILNIALTAFEQELKLQHEIDALLKKVETDYSEELLEKLAEKQDAFNVLGGYTIKAKAEEILEGLGFKTEELDQPLQNFSGGWRMRVMLAKLLLQRPSLLMLDEPTNHLDLPSIQWLENYISNYEGSILIVSHDREFLDRAVNSIVEVGTGQLVYYPGNYSFYLEEKELRDQVQGNAFRNQQQQIKQTEQFINRFKAKASKARQVQSKVKMLDKLDKVSEVVDNTVTMKVRFSFKQQPGRRIVELREVEKHYPGKHVIGEADTWLERGDKIALIGANGKGKSTLLRLVSGEEAPDKGDVAFGHNVVQAFYAQHQLEALNVENEVLEELKQAGSEKNEQELRSILGSFLFQGDDVFKKIKVLSGGEKSRVALAKTLIGQANFLLLDEPTNHLDIQSVNVLVEALNGYDGSYIIVSHDRHFISKTANKIWWIEDGELMEYPGTYAEWQLYQEQRELEKEQQQASPPPKKAAPKQREQRNFTTEEQHKQKQLKKQLNQAEDRVQELENQKALLETELAEPEVYQNETKLADLNSKYAKLKNRSLSRPMRNGRS